MFIAMARPGCRSFGGAKCSPLRHISLLRSSSNFGGSLIYKRFIPTGCFDFRILLKKRSWIFSSQRFSRRNAERVFLCDLCEELRALCG